MTMNPNTIGAPGDREPVPMPVERDTDNLVMNVYTDAFGGPDYKSQDEGGLYLRDRMESKPRHFRTRVIATPTGRTWPHFARVVDGYKHVNRLERDGWLIRPRTAMGVMLGSLAISVLPTAMQDAADEARIIGHDIHSAIDGPQYHMGIEIDKVDKTGPDKKIIVHADSGNDAGSFTVDMSAVDRFSGRVAKVKRQGGEITSVEITGRSSDDYGSNSSIGIKESSLQDFADERAQAYAEAVRAAIPGEDVAIRIDQNVLTSREKQRVEAAARAAGFDGPDNIIDAIRAVEAGTVSDLYLTEMIRMLFSERRGVVLEANVDMPGEKSVTYSPHITWDKVADVPPADPDRDYHPWLIPLIPIPRLRRWAAELLPKKRWVKVPGRTIYKYGLLHEEEDQAWVKLRPEALLDDNTLVDNPWAYSRKYEHLLRDNRIVDVLRADYKDADGDEKSLRVMFIDSSPAEETIAEFSELLKKFAQIDNGKLAKRISGIFVYPSENAGDAHGDAKRIALGVDQQSPETVLGTYTPILDLVEMHMPTTWNKDAVESMMASFYGPAWIISHEVGGHGSDDNDNKLHLRSVWTHGIPNAYISVDSPWADKMAQVDGVFNDLPNDESLPVRFDITYPVTDREGKTVTMSARVNENDPRLAHASTATIVGFKPTVYGSTDSREHYAEAAASQITGIEIPYREAGVSVHELVADNGEAALFATGYRPDVRTQEVVQRSIGAAPGMFPADFPESVDVEIRHINPHNDRVMQEEMKRARRNRFLRPEELIAILARTRASEERT